MKKYTKRIVVIALSVMMVISLMPGLFSQSAQKAVTFKAPVRPEFSQVSVVQSTKTNVKSMTYADIKKLVWDAIDKAGGFAGQIKDKTLVSLKVNLVNNVGYNPSALLPVLANGVTTDWRVAKAVAEKVRLYNPNGTVYIVEGSANDTNTMFKALGYTKANIPQVNGFIALEKNSGAMYDFNSANLVKVNYAAHKSNNYMAPDENSFFFNKKYYYDADYLISVPVLKNHWDALITGGIKNMAIGGTPANVYGQNGNGRGGVAAHTSQGASPSLDLRKWIHDYYICRPADFVVIDGIQGSQYGPSPMSGTDPNRNGRTSDTFADYYMNMRTIIAGRDAVATDTIQGLITNAKPEDANYLNYLQDSGAGNTDITRIRVIGKQVDEVRKTFKIGIGYKPGKLLTAADLPTTTVSIKSITETSNKLKIALNLSANVKKVEFLIDGKTIGIPVSSNMTSVTLPVPTITTGKHTLTVNAFTQYLARGTASKTFTKKGAVRKLTYGQYEAAFALSAPKIDGNTSDAAWLRVGWSPMNSNWLSNAEARTNAADFTGNFKFLYSGSKLYFLAEITDDKLMTSTNADPTWKYPSFDCLEVFVDEDKSGGDHTFNNNAFAYHLTQSLHAVDLGTISGDYSGKIYDKNVTYTMKSIGSNKYVWEGAITIYGPTFDLNAATNTPVALSPGKIMGVSVAYCDNDGDVNAADPTRDHFYSGNDIPASLIVGGNKNIAWQNASAFGTLFLN